MITELPTAGQKSEFFEVGSTPTRLQPYSYFMFPSLERCYYVLLMVEATEEDICG